MHYDDSKSGRVTPDKYLRELILFYCIFTFICNVILKIVSVLSLVKNEIQKEVFICIHLFSHVNVSFNMQCESGLYLCHKDVTLIVTGVFLDVLS